MNRETALKIFEEVKQNYDLVAESFSNTRKSMWQEYKPLADYVRAGNKILDLGCGNGRLVDLFKGKPIEYTGIDNSEKLVEIAKKRYPTQEFRVFDGLKIPFENDSFDAVFCIAVLQHIPGKQLRGEFLAEAERVLKPGGKLILTVWDVWNRMKYWRLLFKFTIKKLIGKSGLDFHDIEERWFIRAKRYFHLFKKRELEREVKKAGFSVEKIGTIKRGKYKNLLIIAKK